MADNTNKPKRQTGAYKTYRNSSRSRVGNATGNIETMTLEQLRARWAALDERLGRGQGAVKERTRLVVAAGDIDQLVGWETR
jgi:hypothetical protein